MYIYRRIAISVLVRNVPCSMLPLLCVFGLLSCSSGALAQQSTPNILMIVADDLGYSDVGSYGGEIDTPNLDALANNGLRFTQFYNSGRCWPSRAALLTGFYAQHVRRDAVEGSPWFPVASRPAWAPLLPAMLKAKGYRAYHSGKWHIDGTPIEGGFDRSYEVMPSSYFSGMEYEDGKPGAMTALYNSIAISNHAIEQLKDHAAHFMDRPFFQYVAFHAPHLPLQAPAEDIARYKGRYEKGWDDARKQRWESLRKMGLVATRPSSMERRVGPPYAIDDLEQLGQDEVYRAVSWDSLSSSERRFQAAKMEIYAAMVSRMDREIGRILQQLKVMRVFDNTLVLFFSDNGATAEMLMGQHDPHSPMGSAPTFLTLGPGWSSVSNTPFRRHKIWVHEGGISTPLIAHWPRGIFGKGELRSVPSHIIDLVPTILELTGLTFPKTWNGMIVPPPPGRSLVPVLLRSSSIARDYLWWMHEGNRALRMGDLKIVSAPDRSGWDFEKIVRDPKYWEARMAEALRAPWELYNLKDDRSELHNLANRYPGQVREMARLWTIEYENARRLRDPIP